MSFREKSAWISLATYLLVYGWYFWALASAMMAGNADTAHFMNLLVGSVFFLIQLEIVLHVIAAIQSPKEAMAPEDERERLIELKATRIAYFVVSSGAVFAVGAIFFGVDNFHVANGLFFALVLSVLAKCGSQVIYYRLGA